MPWGGQWYWLTPTIQSCWLVPKSEFIVYSNYTIAYGGYIEDYNEVNFSIIRNNAQCLNDMKLDNNSFVICFQELHVSFHYTTRFCVQRISSTLCFRGN